MYTAVGDMYLPVCDFDRNVFMYVQLLGSTPCHFAHGVCILNLPVTSSRGVAKAAMLPPDTVYPSCLQERCSRRREWSQT